MSRIFQSPKSSPDEEEATTVPIAGESTAELRANRPATVSNGDDSGDWTDVAVSMDDPAPVERTSVAERTVRSRRNEGRFSRPPAAAAAGPVAQVIAPSADSDTAGSNGNGDRAGRPAPDARPSTDVRQREATAGSNGATEAAIDLGSPKTGAGRSPETGAAPPLARRSTPSERPESKVAPSTDSGTAGSSDHAAAEGNGTRPTDSKIVGDSTRSAGSKATAPSVDTASAAPTSAAMAAARRSPETPPPSTDAPTRVADSEPEAPAADIEVATTSSAPVIQRAPDGADARPRPLAATPTPSPARSKADHDDTTALDLGQIETAAPQADAPDISPSEDETSIQSGDGLLLDDLNKVQRSRLRRRLRRELKQRQRDERWSRKYRARRHRILPRSVLGIAFNLVAFAAGTALSGVLLFAWYDSKLTDTERTVTDTLDGFNGQFDSAINDIEALREETTNEIDQRLEAVRVVSDNAAAVTELPEQVGPSIWYVRTLDGEGQASVGSAFVVGSSSSGSFLLTSLAVVRAATTEPAPSILLEHQGREIAADLHDWDDGLDLAVLTVPDGDLPTMDWVDAESARSVVGDNAFAISGLGGSGGSVSYGQVVDQTVAGLRTDIQAGSDFRGAPLTTRSGNVLGVFSQDYAPLGFAPGDISFAVPITETCGKILDCGASLGDEELARQQAEAEQAEAIARGEDPGAEEVPPEDENGEAAEEE